MRTAIQTTDLTKCYEGRAVVDALNLTVYEGELFALLGVNGAGKTTTIKMLSGVLPPTSGDALLLGDSVVSSPLKVKESINISPQETAVARNLSVRENLELMARIYGEEKAQARIRAEEQMADFGLLQVANKRPGVLSGGMQRRLSIAMALISRPKILFLDEPTLGLDVLARRELWKTIGKIKETTTVILTTHYMEEAEALSDRIGIMAGGRLKALGTVSELMEKSGAASLEDAFIALAAVEEEPR